MTDKKVKRVKMPRAGGIYEIQKGRAVQTHGPATRRKAKAAKPSDAASLRSTRRDRGTDAQD